MMDEEFTDALSALSDETRVAILRTLADADTRLTFSELQSRVGVSDSGRFNYHLRELEGHFVHTDGEGYELTYRGKNLVLASGSGVSLDTTGSAAVSSECPVCGETDCDRLVHVHLTPTSPSIR